MSDSLENGAGYSSHLGTREAENLLRFLTGQGDPSFYGPLAAASHAGMCQTSCPDCLRDFSNLAFHNILDWRLGFDLARLALDPNAPIDFTVAYWQGLAAPAAAAYFAAQTQWQSVSLPASPQAAVVMSSKLSCIRCGAQMPITAVRSLRQLSLKRKRQARNRSSSSQFLKSCGGPFSCEANRINVQALQIHRYGVMW